VQLGSRPARCADCPADAEGVNDRGGRVLAIAAAMQDAISRARDLACAVAALRASGRATALTDRELARIELDAAALSQLLLRIYRGELPRHRARKHR
jgi:hypothetical protein